MRTCARSSRPFALGFALLVLLVVLLAVSASAALADSPVTWQPAASNYGPLPSPTPFATGFPIPDGYGGAAGGTLPTTAVAGGVWDAASSVYTVGFAIPPITVGGLPSMAQTELSATPLEADTRLSMMFTKAAGQRVDSIAMLADPDAPVSLSYNAATLTASTQFTVVASVAEPVASAGGKVNAAFGMAIDCSPAAGRDAYGSIFVTDMSWLDIAPPAFTSSGVAGLSANGANGVKATFDGILSPELLAYWGVKDPATVQGFVGSSPIAGLTGATFARLGTGANWPAGYEKYRVTNSAWSKHDILWGVSAPPVVKPAKAVGTSPKGTVRGTKPTFKWRAVSGARSYELRVYKGSKQLLMKAGVTGLSWKASKALPKGANLTWKVKAVNKGGAGPWSAALRFKIR
jgi:hypothetical protein